MDLALDEDGDVVGQREDFFGPMRHEHDGRGAVFERPLAVGEERRRRSAISDANVCARICTNCNRTATDRGARTIASVFIRQLEYLAALGRERHFGRASAACHVSQPTLSAGIRSLEHELGFPLVRRGRRFEGLTPEGERILGWAERALADLESLSQEASRLRGGLEGMLRIGAIPTSLPLSPRLTARFRERHPRMRVRLTSMTSRQIAYGLEHGELDAGMTYLDNEPLTLVDTLPLSRERYLLVVPRDGKLGGADRPISARSRWSIRRSSARSGSSFPTPSSARR